MSDQQAISFYEQSESRNPGEERDELISEEQEMSWFLA